MKPEIYIELAGFALTLKSYVLLAWIGALSGTIIALPLLKREGLSGPRSLILLLSIAVAFLVGARLFNYLINPDAYGKGFEIYTLRLVGLSFYGGVLGAFFVVLLYARTAKVSALPLLDALVLPAGISFSLARVGCFLNGCCRGIVTESPLGVAFPISKAEEAALERVFSFFKIPIPQILYYPTQLFELALALIGLIPILWLYFKGKLPKGGAFLLYGIWFSAMRLAMLPLRILPYSPAITGVFYPAFYVGLILGGSLYFTHLYRKKASDKSSF